MDKDVKYTHTHTHTRARAHTRICREASHMPLVVKKSTCQCRRHKRCGFDPWVVKTPGEGNGNPLQYSRPGNPMNGRTWWATVHGVTKSRTGLSNWECVHAYIYIYIYIAIGYYSAIRKNEIVPFSAIWMDLEIIILSKVWQRKTNIVISLICGTLKII